MYMYIYVYTDVDVYFFFSPHTLTALLQHFQTEELMC